MTFQELNLIEPILKALQTEGYTTPTNESCNSANGSITATGSGGSGAPYSYSLNGDPYQSSGDFSDLTAGTYTVSVMDSGGCIKTSTVIITNSGGPSRQCNAV